jgi:ATP-dependent phosphoenolpyruvate carboxykinase
MQVANPSVAALYEDALVYESGSAITASGALTAFSGAKTGRSPSDKRIVREPSSENEVWWGPVNKPISPDVSCHLTLKFEEAGAAAAGCIGRQNVTRRRGGVESNPGVPAHLIRPPDLP